MPLLEILYLLFLFTTGKSKTHEVKDFTLIFGRNINHFTLDIAKSKIDKFSNIANWQKLTNKQIHCKVVLNSFPVNGHTLGFFPYNQRIENFVLPKVSPWESKD